MSHNIKKNHKYIPTNPDNMNINIKLGSSIDDCIYCLMYRSSKMYNLYRLQCIVQNLNSV